MPRKKIPAATKAAAALADVLTPPEPGAGATVTCPKCNTNFAIPADPVTGPPASKPVLLDRTEQLRTIVENPPPRPSTAAFLDHWFALSGGPAQFALDLRREYDAAPPGSQIRQRIIEVIMRAMNLTDKQDGTNDDMGLLTDDDLFRMMKSVGERIVAAEDAKGK